MPDPARTALAAERPAAPASAPLFVVRYRTRGGQRIERRILGQRIWRLVKALGRRLGVPELHPHAFRHGCGVELQRRTGGNLRAVQAYNESLYQRSRSPQGPRGSPTAEARLRERFEVRTGRPPRRALCAFCQRLFRNAQELRPG